MQVLVVLADAGGQVVTRETLFQRCWGGVYVGDDSLNRAIMSVRKLAADVAGGSFEIETIPRTGYRLTGADAAPLADPSEPDDETHSQGFSRRELASGAIGVAALAGIAGWSFLASRPQRRFDALLGSAERAIRSETADDRTVADLRQAVALRPDSARAWGLLAYLTGIGTVSSDPKIAAPALKQAQEAAASAFAIDPKEPFALLAMFELQGSTLDWAQRDGRLRQIIAIDRSNTPAIGELVLLTQAAGLNRESWSWNERAIALEPFSFDYLSKRALKLWIAGRTSQADKVIDQVVALYPANPWPWWVRFLIFAMTDRPRAARAMFDARPQWLGPPGTASLWRAALDALEQRSPENLAKVRDACVKAAEASGSFAVDTVMILSALDEIDAAFNIANGFLLSRGSVLAPSAASPGSIVARGKNSVSDDMNEATWRINTQYLFTPPCRTIRADPRFLALCDGVGLTDYWRARAVRPDYQLSER